VAYPDDARRIVERAALADARVSLEQADALAAYLDVLRRWNQKSNLTAFELTPPTDPALDRLIIEPIVASSYVRPTDELLVDIGSGGGSPAIPLRVMAPRLRAILVEARTRKAAFLREVVRQLGLDGVEVENRRFEDLAGPSEIRGAADLATVRAVRTTATFWFNARNIIKPTGQLFLMGTVEDVGGMMLPKNLKLASDVVLVPTNGSHLAIVHRLD
jgi:16S rRNA (guanine527-N7)-methyltransferase